MSTALEAGEDNEAPWSLAGSSREAELAGWADGRGLLAEDEGRGVRSERRDAARRERLCSGPNEDTRVCSRSRTLPPGNLD